MLRLLFSTTILVLSFGSSAAIGRFIKTPSGFIKSRTVYHNGVPVRAFLGIPYAKPPVGELRFKKTVPVGQWDRVLDATQLPPGCVQYSTNPFPFLDDMPGLSEDCLYLNVWAPATSSAANRKTVMFWIHGGGFRISSSRIDFFQGQALAAEGDVIVVTINYRLGVEGFLYSATEEAPGNMGMWDILEALRWVRSNIESFGGNKNSITLFGHSAGGIAIGMLCVSPLSRGLFKRAILQSGVPTNLSGKDNSRSFEISQQLAVAAGCASEESALQEDPQGVVECLRGKYAFELEVTLSNVTANSPRSYYPRYGDDLLPVDPREAIIRGDFAPVSVLIGTNNGDGATLITKSMKEVFGFFGEKYPRINYTFGASIIEDKFKSYPDPEVVVDQYLGKVAEDDYNRIRYEVFTASGDYSRVCPSNYFAESFAKKGVSVYYYFFIHRPSNSPYAPWMLAVHFDETPFVFGYPLRYPQLYTVEELALSKRMIQAWTSFAKIGKPIFGVWPAYSRENPSYQVLHVGNSLVNGYGPHKENCDFFRSYFGF